ncbi:hypothetical protein LTS14_005997 [Recurvomyces mirabilis]|uniref:uncharacterized protein n=1 Tax=Recurvomyces mirabilis TaxID=574656 RepID=UPI002DDFAA90|nr:hypothetical protein LTS14_005997 [Recurvomyces mirabilis]
MSGEKRAASESFGTTQLVKRQRSDADLNGSALARTNGAGGALIKGGNASTLSSPVMELTGHSSEVLAARFSPDGTSLATAGMDRQILLWRTAGSCENYTSLSGHKAAVLALNWSRDSQVLYSASADHTLASWDLNTSTRIRRHIGHEEVVNCLDVSKRGEEFLVSGSDDASIGIWDPRQKHALDHIQTEYPITAICLAEAGNEVFAGGIDNVIKIYDLRMKKVSFELAGHTDTITSLSLSPDTQTLLSYSHDSTARTWDIRPFAPQDRQIRVFDGAQAGLEKNLFRACWDREGKRVAVGGGEGVVTVWEAASGKMVARLPGHKGSVNEVDFSPDGTVVASGSTDRRVLLDLLRAPNRGNKHVIKYNSDHDDVHVQQLLTTIHCHLNIVNEFLVIAIIATAGLLRLRNFELSDTQSFRQPSPQLPPTDFHDVEVIERFAEGKARCEQAIVTDYGTVFKQPLAVHSTSPMTGFLRNGYCEVPASDYGNHAVAAEVTEEFLDFTARQGNDLRPIPGMKAGCKCRMDKIPRLPVKFLLTFLLGCLCTTRWLEAFQARDKEAAGDKIVPKIFLNATNEKALNKINLDDLKAFAADK